MSKHTPGPYSISGIAGDNYIMAGRRTGRNRQKIAIAQVIGFPTITNEEHEANKEFIVTALNAHAELLEACGAALFRLDEEAREAQGAFWCLDLRRKLLKAIQVAKPETELA